MISFTKPFPRLKDQYPIMSMPSKSVYLKFFILLIILSSLCSCARFRNSVTKTADRHAYKIIADKQVKALGEAKDFSIAQANDELTSRVCKTAEKLQMDIASFTTPTCLVSLADALALAFGNNRDYLTQKESLFEASLGLEETRWNYGTIFTAEGDASYSRTKDQLGIERFGAYDFTLGLSRKIAATGANISAAYTHNFLKAFGHNAADPTSSNGFNLNIVPTPSSMERGLWWPASRCARPSAT